MEKGKKLSGEVRREVVGMRFGVLGEEETGAMECCVGRAKDDEKRVEMVEEEDVGRRERCNDSENV